MNTKTSEYFKDRIFVAYDKGNLQATAALAGQLEGLLDGVKVGSVFFTAQGPAGVLKVFPRSRLFLDLKFHDIPETVYGAVRSAVKLHPWGMTVHASGGVEMMRSARRAAVIASADAGRRPPLILAVTVLTSLDCRAAEVGRLAADARGGGMDGVVCSGREVAALRARFGPNFILMAAGVRPRGAGPDDQKRTTTPAEAFAAGADYIVIGRPITAAVDPVMAARRIVDDLVGA